MMHPPDPGRPRRDLRATTGLALAFSLLFVGVVESSHPHGSPPDASGSLSVCPIAQNPASTTGSGAPVPTGPGLLPVPVKPHQRSIARIVRLASNGSRAPPRSISRPS